jgi:hypothetical protein
MMGTELLGPVDAERYAPITEQDLIDHAVDQVRPWGTLTRFAPPSRVQPYAVDGAAASFWPGSDPDTIGWTANPGAARPQPPHYPSKLAREGCIRNFVPNFGIEDRGDGGGVVGLASKPEALEAQLKKYAAAPV